MRQGLSLKYVMGGGIALMIGAILVVCVQILSTYTGHGVDYIGSYIMERSPCISLSDMQRIR